MSKPTFISKQNTTKPGVPPKGAKPTKPSMPPMPPKGAKPAKPSMPPMPPKGAKPAKPGMPPMPMMKGGGKVKKSAC